MKKKMAAILLCFLVLQSTFAVYAASPEDIAITSASVQESKVVIGLKNLTPNAMISFQAFYTGPEEGAVKQLDYINQYTLDSNGATTFDYPTRSEFAAGGTLTVVIGEAGLTTEDRTRTYTFSAYEINKIQIRTLED